MKITEDFIGNETKTLTKTKISAILRWWGFNPDSYSTWGNARSDMNNILSGTPTGEISDRERASTFLSKINYVNDIDAIIGDTIFAAGVPGVWYDPSNLSTLFQDTAGTIPVTGVEQPVGLMLDKSRGGRGPNLTPPTDQLSGWLGAVNNTISNDGGGVVSTNTVNTRVALRVANIIQPGVYEVEVDLEAWINSTGSASIRVAFSSSTAFGGALSFPSTMTNIPGEGRHQRRAIVTVTEATHSGLLVGTNAATEIQAGSWIKLHSVSVRRIDGNHASQATTTARPILSARYNLLSSSAGVGAAPWNSTAGTFSFAPAVPYIGNEAYRITNNGTGTFRFIAHPFTVQVGTYTVSAIVEEDVFNPSEYTDLGLLQAPSTTLGRIRIHWPTGSIGSASAFPLNLRGSMLSSMGPNGGRVFSIQFEVNVTAVGEHRVLFYPSSTTQNTTGVILHCIDVRLSVDAALPSFQTVTSPSNYDTAGFPYYLRFDGVDDHLSIPSLNFSGASSAVAVIGMKKLNDVTSTRPYSHGVNTGQTGAFRFLAPANPGQASLRAAVRSADGTLSEPAGANDKPAPINVVMLAAYGNGESTTVRFNGSETRIASGGPLAGLVLPNTRAVIGAQVTGDTTQSGFFVGRISGLLHIGRSLSETERRVVERFINNKTRAY